MRPISERLPPTIRNLVVLQAIVFGFYVMVGSLRAAMTEHLALGPNVASGELWQPLTSLFIHLEWWSFIFDLIGLWFVGATIERAFGRRRFLLLFFGSGLAANCVVAFLSAGLHRPALYAGCGDAVLALFVALGVLYGRAQVRVIGTLVLQARVLSGILIGMAVLSALLQAAWASLAGSLVAVAVAFFLSGGKGMRLTDVFSRWRRFRRRGFQVIDGGRKKSGKTYVN
jgi:membrane associated rhomboid family serine protease